MSRRTYPTILRVVEQLVREGALCARMGNKEAHCLVLARLGIREGDIPYGYQSSEGIRKARLQLARQGIGFGGPSRDWIAL